MIPRPDERPRTIALRWNGQYEEARASLSGIKPGYLIELLPASTGVPTAPALCKPHDTQGGATGMLVAIEDRLGGKAGSAVGRSIDTEYDDEDIVPFIALSKGDVFQARVAGASAWQIGDLLTSAGTGLFEATGGGDTTLAVVEENVDHSDSDFDDEFLVRARVL